jgi:NAD(P)H-nitrite reductase large subunit
MKIVVVGSGLAGVTVAQALAKNACHEVTIVTAEGLGYYSRPRLSHGLSCDEAAAGRIVLKPFAALAPVKVVLETVEDIDRERRQLVLAGGKNLAYDLLILATGSAARIPAVLAPHRFAFRTLNSLEDLLTLRARRAARLARGIKPRWAIIGGGLIGCELASDLNAAGDAVTILHREDRLLELQFDPPQSAALLAHFESRGVAVRLRQDVRSIDPEAFDETVVCTGFVPRTELARDAGLPVGSGIIVDSFLRTADESIFAAGDVAEVGGRLYPFVSPIRSQALWLADHTEGRTSVPWSPPRFSPMVKIHGFKLPAAALTPA